MTYINSYTGAIRLKLIGFNNDDRSKFESIFSIAQNKLDVTWQIVDSLEADFYLLGYRLRTQIDKNTLLKTLPRNKCIFYTFKETECEDNELIVGKQNLPSLRSLLSVLNKLSATNH